MLPDGTIPFHPVILFSPRVRLKSLGSILVSRGYLVRLDEMIRYSSCLVRGPHIRQIAGEIRGCNPTASDVARQRVRRQEKSLLRDRLRTRRLSLTAAIRRPFEHPSTRA